MQITHIYFDIGGVLGTGGWDTGQRARAAEEFGLDGEDFEQRHDEAVGMLEVGRMSLDEYLDVTVFDVPRAFSRDEFRDYMLAQSQPYPETIEIARALARSGRYSMMTLNNESAELNVHRIRHFGLAEIFATFFSSCWVGSSKPSRRIYQMALTMCRAEGQHALFIDDRPQNLPPARALGMHVIHYTSAEQLANELAALGIVVQ